PCYNFTNFSLQWTIVSIAFIIRSFLNFLVNHVNEKQEQQKINSHKQYKRKKNLTSCYRFRKGVGSTQQTINHPGLPAHFGGKPTNLIGNLGQESGKNKYHHQPSVMKQLAAPPQET